MDWNIIRTLVVKDLVLFSRNRFFALVSLLGVVAYAGIYFVMPRDVDETLELALFAPDVPPIFEQMESQGLEILSFSSEQELKEAVTEGDVAVGIVLPADFTTQVLSGQRSRADVYFTAELPEEFQGAYTTLLQELAFMMSGQVLQVEVNEQVLGVDRAGSQIPPRDRMLPLFAVFILIIETMGLASLIAAEVETGTLRALLVTPLRMEGLFVAKGVMGVGLAFVQASLLMLVTGGFSQQPAVILVALLVGALLVTGIGFLIASVGRDMMSVMAWGMLVLVLLSLPAFGVLLPGTVSDWVRIVPSFYLVDTVHQAANFGIGWSELWQNVVILLLFAALIFAAGVFTLRRRFERPVGAPG